MGDAGIARAVLVAPRVTSEGFTSVARVDCVGTCPSVEMAALQEGTTGDGEDGGIVERSRKRGGERGGMCMRVIASGFANAAWRTGLTQNKVDHPGSPSSGFHSSVTVERGPRELTGLILPRLSATTGRTKPNATCVAMEFPKAAITGRTITRGRVKNVCPLPRVKYDDELMAPRFEEELFFICLERERETDRWIGLIVEMQNINGKR